MLIGREKEKKTLLDAYADEYSHFVAVYGRRRIGKTFLIRETFGYRFTFQHSGLSSGTYAEQLYGFESSLKDAGYTGKGDFSNWLEAFDGLKELIRSSTEKKKIIFIDELSWMDTPRCNLMTALENFWNGWASARKDVLLIVCASATSWMLNNVIHNKGGLYNRLTERIHLESFNLAECEKMAKAMGLILTRDAILQCYMILGGVPYYWGLLKKGKSVEQNINAMFFEHDAPLKDEYYYLYASVFRRPTDYMRIIEALGKKKAGMTREEIISATGLANSGTLTDKLNDLEHCGFVRKYLAYGMKKKEALYQLIDFFTLFYLQFMLEQPKDDHFWSNQLNTPVTNTWKGLAFERVCLEHIKQIKQKLGISGVLSDVNSWRCSSDKENGIYGSQIDLLIARRDRVVNLCEMKYSESEFSSSEKVSKSIRNKISDFTKVTGTRCAVHPVLVTNVGLLENAYSGDFQAVITARDLFEK